MPIPKTSEATYTVQRYVETLNDSDPTFRERFLKKMGEAYYKLRDDTPGDQIEQLELISWTRSFLTGFDFIEGQGEPLLDSKHPYDPERPV